MMPATSGIGLTISVCSGFSRRVQVNLIQKISIDNGVELLVHDLLPVSVQGTLTICIDKLQVLETIRDNAPVVSVIDD